MGHDDLHPGDTPTEHPVLQHLLGWGGLRVGRGQASSSGRWKPPPSRTQRGHASGQDGCAGTVPREACARVFLGPGSVRTVLWRQMVCSGLRNCHGWENNEKNLPKENTEEGSARSREEGKPRACGKLQTNLKQSEVGAGGGGRLELSECQCRGIWPDGGSECVSSVRYTLINFSRLHQSYTSNSQNTN